jgi:probable rRNA maturation factor
VIEVEIEDEAWAAVLPDAVEVVQRAALAALAGRMPNDMVALLTDDATVKDFNARFRGKDAPTNVLSFPAPASARPHLGDIVLAYGVCAREAAAQGKRLADHLTHLTAHGVLHLLGYDHETDADAEVMEGLERSILVGLGVADPYADDHAPDHAL